MDTDGLSPEIIPPQAAPAVPGQPADPQQPFKGRPNPRRRERRWFVPLVLFLMTCWSTYDGRGLTYAVAVMAILGAHEMGHFVQALRYGVPASFPYFIPMPFNPLGTMGAVIVQQAGVADRKALFDIAISGPLAGLVVALPMLIWGMTHSTVANLPPDVPVFLYGDPLLIKWMTRLVHGTLGPGQEIGLPPVGFAGWVGIFITGLNLVPIGQLDGGHILYTLLRKKAHVVAGLVFSAAVVFVIYGGLFIDNSYFGWSLLLFLLWLMGPRHPATADDFVPLGAGRIVLGWLTLLFLFVGFTPTPFYEYTYHPEKPAGNAERRERVKKPEAPAFPARGPDVF